MPRQRSWDAQFALRRLGALLTLAIAVAPVAGCGGSSSKSHNNTPGPTQATPAPSVAASPSLAVTGCDSSPTQGTVALALTVAGHGRTVIVHVPAGYTSTEAVPLVLNMHGSGSTASGEEAFTGMDNTADANNFIVAYPQGAISAGSGFDWNVPGQPLIGGAAVPASAPDDIGFLKQLVTILGQRYCIDPTRVYATGFSGGARLASQLGCDASEIFAAIAPVSGLRLPSPCPATRPMAVLSFHGTADPIDPYGGNGQKYWTYSVPTAAQDWAMQDGCLGTPITTSVAPTVSLQTFGGCRDGSSVALYSISGEGHEWPGGPKLSTALVKELGPQSTAIDADNLMWSFFQQHRLS